MAETDTKRELLSPEFMHQLDRLDVLSRKILAGRMQGERRSKRKGRSVEFADYRNYVAGDDLRFLDWNLYARLNKLFLRLFLEEEDLLVTVAVDVSASMDYGDPNKLLYARQLAAALGYIGLVNYNRVSLYTFASGIRGQLPSQRGRRPLPRMLDFLASQRPAPAEAGGDLTEVCKRLSLLQRSPGMIILISDFFDKGDLSQSLRYLADDRQDVYAVQLLSPQEMDPRQARLEGDLRLRDVEDADVAEVTITPELIRRYRANLEAWCQHVRQQCVRRGISYLMSETSVPFETVVLKYLRERGLLK
ncbi:MAG: DUF58 domain-containing protein [Phycisphaeraceae bacterium]